MHRPKPYCVQLVYKHHYDMKVLDKYKLYIRDDSGRLSDVNPKAFDLADECFEVFKDAYNHHYGSISEIKNLISIHTGGWSDNEELIAELKQTAWWVKVQVIQASGGHYYINTDTLGELKWTIKAVTNNQHEP